MISLLEASYWNTLLVELNSQQELAALKEKLAQDQSRKIPNFPKRWRWRNRQSQLEKGLDKLNVKLTEMESQIGFTEKINTRQKASEPLRQRSG
jgi:hypothetical protein